MIPPVRIAAFLLLAVLLGACSSAYYGALDKFGVHKRDILLTRVKKARDSQVLFLKHNLNARAIAALEGRVARVQVDVTRLIRDMERSIAEAEAFIQSMNAP